MEKPILDGARSRFRVSSAEVGGLDRWQRVEVGFALVSVAPHQASAIMDEVEGFVWSFPEVEVLFAERSWLEQA